MLSFTTASLLTDVTFEKCQLIITKAKYSKSHAKIQYSIGMCHAVLIVMDVHVLFRALSDQFNSTWRISLLILQCALHHVDIILECGKHMTSQIGTAHELDKSVNDLV